MATTKVARKTPRKTSSRTVRTLPMTPGSLIGGKQGVPSGEFGFLDTEHQIFKAWRRRWELNEARLIGGDSVLPELRPFPWETERGVGSHYQSRLDDAIYLNFGEIFTTAITGQLLRFAPKPGQGFNPGELGVVNTEPNWKNPSQADMLWYSVDRPNNLGVSWNVWWMDELKMAMATGHRWIYCDTPPEDAVTKTRELAGIRPYLAGFSPLDVPNWYYNLFEELEWAILRFTDYNTDDKRLSNISTTQYRHYLLVVKAGVTRFGTRFEKGGWWKFYPNKELYDEGTWADTDGEIPMWLLFYERSKGTKRMPAISRPGITELGQASIAYMNNGSAANFQAWNNGNGIEWLAGVDEEGMELANGQLKRGDRYIALPPNQDTDATPQVFQSGSGAPTSDVFTAREEAISYVATQLGIGEAFGQNSGATGASKSAEFTATQVPRIVKAAENLASAQRLGIKWFAKRLGYENPTGNAVWSDKFDLVELVERIQQFFTVERLAGIRSASIDAKGMTDYAKEKGLVHSDADEATALNEYKKSAKQRDAMEQAQAAQLTNPNASLNQPGAIGGKMKTGRSAARDKAREAGKKVDKSTAKRNVGAIPRRGR